ncbi:hypothetical protein WG66_008878 [Moniliophthora roreri]|nr:hypothetical protein WG66_008878 [Moniliophthora roreri]
MALHLPSAHLRPVEPAIHEMKSRFDHKTNLRRGYDYDPVDVQTYIYLEGNFILGRQFAPHAYPASILPFYSQGGSVRKAKWCLRRSRVLWTAFTPNLVTFFKVKKFFRSQPQPRHRTFEVKFRSCLPL